MMTDKRFPLSMANIVGLSIVIVVLYFTSYHDFLLFHSLTEIFSFVIAFGIFLIAWNSRKIQKNHYLLFLGIAYLFVGCFDLLHTLFYKGMMIFHDQDANIPTQLWIISRYTESISLFIAPLFLTRKLHQVRTLSIYLALAVVILWSVFAGIFPTCYTNGVGLTPFKIYSEYIISAILAGALVMLWLNRDRFNRGIFNLLAASIVLTIGAELAFTSYISVYGMANIVGHFLKFISFYLIYKALVETGLKEPYELLFRDLKESEEKYRTLFSNMLDGFAYHKIILDANGTPTDYVFLEVNAAFEKMTGLQRKNVIGKNVTSIIPGIKNDEFDWIGEYGKVALEGTTLRTEQYSKPLDRWFSISAYCPEKHYFAAVFEDITLRRKAEQSLRESEEKFLLMANSINDVIWMSSSDGREILYVNPAYRKIWGRKLDKLYAGEHSFEDNIHPEDLESVRQLMWQNPQEKWESVHRIVRPDGTFRWINNSSTPVVSPDGEVRLRVGIARDITEHKQAELDREEYFKHLNALMHELERSNNDLQEFANIVSHDLQEPLRTVSSFVQLLVNRYHGELDDKADQYLNFILDGTTRMQTLLRDLLSFARLGGGQLRLEHIDLQSTLKKVLQNLDVKISENQAKIINKGLPEVVADEMQMMHLLQNLVTNGIKFRGDEYPVLTVNSNRKNGEWVISVTDNGIGIDPKFADRIFLIFQRLHRRGEYEGTGMGLAICKKIVERHNGRIWVESTPGKGSAFHFTLPAPPEPEPQGLN